MEQRPRCRLRFATASLWSRTHKILPWCSTFHNRCRASTALTLSNSFCANTCPHLDPLPEGEEVFKLCKPDILYILNRAHGLHFFEVSCIRSPFLQNARRMETITELLIAKIL